MRTQNHFTNVATMLSLLFVMLSGGLAEAKDRHSKHQSGIIQNDGKRGKHLVKETRPYRNIMRGLASWYGYESGNKTASGSRFNPLGLTAAHRTLPLNTRVRVTNTKNGRSVDVTVNDRGPYRYSRIIDLSLGAAKAIGIKGLGMVEIAVLN